RGMLTYDVPLTSDTLDLANEGQYLALSERLIADLAESPVPRGRLSVRSRGVLVGRDVVIDASARLVPPLVLQDGVQVGADSVLVGPLLMGRASRVEPGGMAAQSVVLPGAVVEPGATVRHC